MDSCGDEDYNYSEVIDNLMNMFGNVMSKDVISAVVESCDGDLNLSMDAIMNITSDGNVISEEEHQLEETNQIMTPIQAQPISKNLNMPPTQDQPIIQTNENITTMQSIQQVPPINQPTTSYAAFAAHPALPCLRSAYKTGAIPKQIQRPIQWTDQIRQMIKNHNEGNRIMILMRGVPGSGKSYLARQVIDMIIGPGPMNYKTHIFSTDDFFMVRGVYKYDKCRLTEAHNWNQNRVRDSAKKGLSPIIIDNTNIELWEMEPYLREGVSNGYIIEVLEPSTPWAKKPNQLVKKNSHDVPLATIKRMLDNYRGGVTGEILMQTYRLSYPAGMVPPVKRTILPCNEEESPAPEPSTSNKELNTAASNIHLLQSPTSTVEIDSQPAPAIDNPNENKNEINLGPPAESKGENTSCKSDSSDELSDEEQAKQRLLEAQKKLEELEKVEKEWENGENWDTDNHGAVANNATIATCITSVAKAKPQRKPLSVSPPELTSHESTEALMLTVNNCQDWSKISMFMPPWTDSSEPSTSIANLKVPVETMSSSTSMEIGDTNIDGKNKVITATPRNINEFYISFNKEKIPQKRMLDKSSMTNEGIITNTFRCSNEEKHFIAFRKLFKNIARSDLRDIFDKCCGDVNWSVEIVLDGMSNNEFQTIETEESSDPEEESTESCACLAYYNIIPDVATVDVAQTKPDDDDKLSEATGGPQPQKKKREATMSEENIQIKRQIEQNVVIADNHYSKHCLKIRKMRRGEPDISENSIEEEPSTSGKLMDDPLLGNYTSPYYDSDDDGSNVSETEEDAIVTINLGDTFIAELDQLFGREDMQYPSYILPRISVPLSMLNEFNALWMESFSYQLDEQAKKTAAMVQQDEEFARQIAMKEAELSLAGKEPAVPDFKEIMDMELALSIYQKDISEWRNNMPTDLAAKMTRDKLFNLFPEVDQDTLIELLMAHDNSFNATVEALLMSTGRHEILEEENGINKFIMSEEMKRKDKILNEQRKELSESEWPLLSKDLKVDMSTVESYRKEADEHLDRRNQNYQKAQECVRRGMTQVANYYSDIANFHRQKYEQANGLAVASLMQFHALNNPDCTTIDLHYLRVKEAKESLDIFIDTHISKLKEAGIRRNQVLFFITGRGKNSQGRARIKPATMRRLKERGLGYTFKNPGLLAANINGDTKLTYQVSVP